MRKGLNPTVLLVIMLGVGFQVAFTKSVTMNVIVAVVSFAYLLFRRVRWQTLGMLLLITVPLAFGTWWSFIAFGVGDTWHLSWIYASRLYAYLFLGAALTLTVHFKDILISLMIHARLSSTFTYGLLAAFNLLPRIRKQVKTIRYSAQLRGLTYHWWQPQIYFKAIVSALRWSGDLAEAMTSHGFSEGMPRTNTAVDPLPVWQWGLAAVLILGFAGMTIFWRPW